MIDKFQDINDFFDHDNFQAWRLKNHVGFFVNVKSPNKLMLHKVECSHHGDFTWKREKYQRNLTRNRKICSKSVKEIQQHLIAEKYDVSKLKMCPNCNPLQVDNT